MTYIIRIPHSTLGVNILGDNLLDLFLGLGDDDDRATCPIPVGRIVAFGLAVKNGAF